MMRGSAPRLAPPQALPRRSERLCLAAAGQIANPQVRLVLDGGEGAVHAGALGEEILCRNRVKPLVRVSSLTLMPVILPVKANCAKSCHCPACVPSLIRFTFIFAVWPAARWLAAYPTRRPGRAGGGMSLFCRRSWMTEICEPGAYAKPTPTLKPVLSTLSTLATLLRRAQSTCARIAPVVKRPVIPHTLPRSCPYGIRCTFLVVGRIAKRRMNPPKAASYRTSRSLGVTGTARRPGRRS